MKNDDELVRMTFVEHLEELRKRLIRSLWGLLAALVFAFCFTEEIQAFIAWPHFWAMDMLGLPREEQRFIAGTHVKPIFAVVKLAFILALFLASPWIGTQIWAFVAAGLYPHERRYVRSFAPVSFLLFVGGCAFGFGVLVPYCLYGMCRFMNPRLVLPTFEFGEYVDLVMSLTIILGAVFQVPLLMVFLSRVGLVPPRQWNAWRRHAIVANVALAAILSPPEFLSMIVVALPLLALYEAGVAVSWLGAPRRLPRPP